MRHALLFAAFCSPPAMSRRRSAIRPQPKPPSRTPTRPISPRRSSSTRGSTRRRSFPKAWPRSASARRYGYIDTKGETVIAPQFDFANPFSEGVAAVGAGTQDRLHRQERRVRHHAAARHRRPVLVLRRPRGRPDRRVPGRQVGLHRQAGQARHRSAVRYRGLVPRRTGGRRQRAQIRLHRQDRARSSSRWNSLPRVRSPTVSRRFASATTSPARTAISTKQGKIVIEPRFEGAFPFSAASPMCASATNTASSTRQGRMVIEPQFDFADSFSGGLGGRARRRRGDRQIRLYRHARQDGDRAAIRVRGHVLGVRWIGGGPHGHGRTAKYGYIGR